MCGRRRTPTRRTERPEATLTSSHARRSADLASLVVRIGRHDGTALAHLYDATASRAYGLARSVLGDDRRAEEALVEAYARVWQAARSYDARCGSVVAWLLAIVHRTAIERRDAVPTSVCPPPDRLDLPATARVDAALAELSTLEWAALQHAYLGGRRTVEVAPLLGVSETAAQALIRQGLRRLGELTRAA